MNTNYYQENKNAKVIIDRLEKETGAKLNFFEVYKNAKGTRFTGFGYNIAKTIWKTYILKLPEQYRVLNKTLILLDQRMTWPYYLSKKYLVLFNEMDAFEFTLYQGDINLWANK